jgi:hypothetical protein
MLMVRILFAVVFCIGMVPCTVAQSFAPEVWATAGGFVTHAHGSVTWTMGETFIETQAQNTLEVTFTQGFNQPFLRKGPTGATQPNSDISPIFTVFPNPTSGIIRIRLSRPYDKPVEVALYNTLGQLMQSDLWLPSTAAPEKELSLENLANGVYFLQISLEGESLGVYKVQKDHH